MKTDIRKQDIDVTWQNLNPGTVVTGGATAPEFNTGEWRVNVPVLDMDKCKQCLMCCLLYTSDAADDSRV